jgi:hypothetical protein
VVSSLELGAIFDRVKVWADAKVTALFGARFDSEHLHRAARPFRERFLHDLGDRGY